MTIWKGIDIPLRTAQQLAKHVDNIAQPAEGAAVKMLNFGI